MPFTTDPNPSSASGPGADGAARISLIIPTLADTARRASLRRAIDSAARASVQPVQILVVVNGQRWDPEVLAQLERWPLVRCLQIAEGSLPKALAHGRAAVQTPYFAFLDDDDELLPGALDARLQVMEAGPPCDVVVSNGWREIAGERTRAMQHLDAVEANPLAALFTENWLASCGGLFRAAGVPQRYLDDHHDFAEWTWLAYCLAIDGVRLRVLDAETFVIHDTAQSRSKSAAYRASYMHLFERMLSRKPPPAVRRLVSARLASTLHDMADKALGQCRMRAAWTYHVRSLALAGGMRYLTFSRRLLRASIARWVVARRGK